MSWSDDMRCLYCDGKLPLYRKITHGQFCSTNHRKAYWQEQERLAVERLHQTHSSLKAMRPVASAESILGPAIPENTVLGGFVAPPQIYPQAQGAPWLLAADPLIYDMELDPDRPVWTASEHEVRSLRHAGVIRLLEVWFDSGKPEVFASPRFRGDELDARPVVLTPVKFLFAATAETTAETEFEVPPIADLLPGLKREVTAAVPALAAWSSCEPLPVRSAIPALPVYAGAYPLTQELEAAPQPEAPSVERLLPLPKFAAQPSPVSITPHDSEALAGPLVWPAYPGRRVEKTAELGSIGAPVELPAFLPAPPGNILAEPRAVSPSAAPQPVKAELTVPLRPARLAMGRGSRYPIQYRHASALTEPAGPADFPLLPADVALPRVPDSARVAPSELLDVIVRRPAGMVPLNVRLGKGVTKPVRPVVLDVAMLPQPLRTEHVILPSRLEPLDAKPISDEFQSGDTVTGLAEAPVKAHPWTNAAKLWKLAPRDMKMLAFAIPALLALAFHRQLPKVHVTAPAAATAQIRTSLHNVVNTELTSMRQAVVERAGVALDDDFRSGLDEWASRGDATAEWSFDPTGFVRPGPLSLYRPTMNLGDYQFQFLGMIDKKALSWVVRASDFDNYYVVKLEVLKPGPITTVGLTRYAVIHGKAENRVDTPVELQAQPDTLYRVSMDLDGENISLTIQGQMIDSWSEPRLPRGGIGFFTARGEESRVRWVSVRHQYDMLGRLCAYLAPYESPTTNGSW